MIDQFTQNDLASLVQKQNDPCVTMFLPTERTGREIYKPVTTLKRLAKIAAQKLSGHWMSEKDAETFLKPVTRLASDHEFWEQTDQGLAIFLNADRLQTWRIGTSVPERLCVSNQFFVLPVISEANLNESFFILSLGQNKPGLFEATATNIRRINVPGMPRNAADVLNLTSVDHGSQTHTGDRQQGGKQGTVFHGQGGKPDSSKEDSRQFYRRINQVVTKQLKTSRQPMFLACVADQAPIYFKVNEYPHLTDLTVAGAADRLTDQELHQRALPCLAEYKKQASESAIESYRKQANTTRAMSEVSDIVAAAYHGQIDKLFINETASLPGELNSVDLTVDYNASSSDFDKDLIESAIAQTLLHRGSVFALKEKEMPQESMMVATLRY